MWKPIFFGSPIFYPLSFSVAGPEFFPEAEMRQQVSGGSWVRGPEDGPDGGPDHVVVGPLPERGQRVQGCPVCYYKREVII